MAKKNKKASKQMEMAAEISNITSKSKAKHAADQEIASEYPTNGSNEGMSKQSPPDNQNQ